MEYILARGLYLALVLSAGLGTYLITSHRNLLKAVAGLYLLQTATIVFFVALSFRTGGTVPIVPTDAAVQNPLPHAMMLTAIVVGVATLGVALAILLRIQSESGTIEDAPGSEDEA